MSGAPKRPRRAGGIRRVLSSVWRPLERWIDSSFEGGRGKTSDANLAQNFKVDVTAIEEAPIPISVYSTLYVVVTLFAAAIIWSVVGKVDRIVVAQGKIITTAPVIVMQPFTTSRIQSIHVQAGDHVKKGQVLISFDPAFAQADEASLEQKVRALTAETARIEAELSGQASFSVGADPNTEMGEQARIFGQRTAQFRAEMGVRDSREKQVDAQIDSNNKSIDGLQRQYDLARKVAEIRRQLQARSAGSALEVMAAEKDEVDFELRLKSAVSDKEKFTQQKAEIVSERQSYLNQWRSDLNQKLVTDHQDMAQASESLNKARRLKDFTELTAPVDAVVLELADRSEGSVLREAETLITLVPDNAELDLEANIMSRDIGFVAKGDPVRVKLEAYPFQQYGTLDGRLDVLSPDSLPVKEGDRTNVVFHGTIHLKDTVGQIAGSGIRLRPGLVATAEIKAGDCSIASYILDPIVQTTDESLREP